jgi:two-component system, response regulator FlrC
VRELENVIQRAMIMAPGDTIDAAHLHLPAADAAAVSLAPAVPEVGAAKPDAQRADSIRDLEREHILETLAAVGGSRKQAVERLGISERTLRYKLKQYKEEGFFDE